MNTIKVQQITDLSPVSNYLTKPDENIMHKTRPVQTVSIYHSLATLQEVLFQFLNTHKNSEHKIITHKNTEHKIITPKAACSEAHEIESTQQQLFMF